MHGIFVQKGHEFEGGLGTIIRTQKGPKKGSKKGSEPDIPESAILGPTPKSPKSPKITEIKITEITGRSKVGLLRVVWRSVWPGPVQHLCRNGEACRSTSYTNYRNRRKRGWPRPRIWGFGQNLSGTTQKWYPLVQNRWRQMGLFFGPKKGPFWHFCSFWVLRYNRFATGFGPEGPKNTLSLKSEKRRHNFLFIFKKGPKSTTSWPFKKLELWCLFGIKWHNLAFFGTFGPRIRYPFCPKNWTIFEQKTERFFRTRLILKRCKSPTFYLGFGPKSGPKITPKTPKKCAETIYRNPRRILGFWGFWVFGVFGYFVTIGV